jgi:Mrp family chromosome partitioning ATPase
MIIAYVSRVDQDCYMELKSEFTDVKNFSALEDFISFYAASKNRDVVLLYRVESLEEIEKLSKIHFTNNIYIIVIGKNDIEFSLIAGKTGVDVYLNFEQANPLSIKDYIINSQKVIKERRGNSNVVVFTGISGGVGTTTITMNLAKSMAERYPEKNVLFLDFAYTKSVSNLFFNVLQPEKTIVDIARVQNMEMEEFFENGLVKVSNNLFIVPGIQKHTDKRSLKKRKIFRFILILSHL